MDRPLYKEHYKIISKKEVTINGNNMTEVVFSGSGRSGGDVSVQGNASFSASDGNMGKASYTFEAIGEHRAS